MAAPTTSYKTQKLIIPKGNSTGGVAIQKDLYIAKFLENTIPTSSEIWGDGYFNSTDTEAQKVAKIKDIFKIDGFLLVAKGAVDGSASETGFIGYCNSKTTGNGAFHKTERFSGVKISTTTNTEAELLNDGSLNVKGTIVVGNGTYITPDLANNGFTLTSTFKSSYYNITSSYGINWRKQGDTVYNTKILGTMDKKEKASFVTQTIDVDPSDILYVEAPNTYEVRAYITNEEGTTELHLGNVVVSPAARTFYFGNDIYGAWLYGTSDTYLQTRRKMLGSILYEELVPTPTPVDAGYYVDKVYSETSLGNGYYYVVCNSSGVVTLEGIFSGQLRTTYGHCGYGTTLALALASANSDADIDISGVHWQSPPYSAYLYSIAYDPNDSKWYNGEAGTIQATDGFYVRGENEFKYYWWQISSGVRVAEGSYGAAGDYEINI